MTKTIPIPLSKRSGSRRTGIAVSARNNQSPITNLSDVAKRGHGAKSDHQLVRHSSLGIRRQGGVGSRLVPARHHFGPVLIVLATVFFATVLQAAPLSQDEITDLVKRLEAVYQNRTSLQANFREERHMAILKDPVVNQGKIWFTPPDKIRREITGNSPSTTVIDGKKMTIFYPNLKTAEQYDLEKRPIIRQSLQALTAGLNFQRVSDYYSIEGTKEDKSYVITLTPKTASIRRLVKSLTLTMLTDLTPEKVDFQSPRGERVFISYSDVKRDPVPDSEYDFTPPSGTNVTNPFGS